MRVCARSRIPRRTSTPPSRWRVSFLARWKVILGTENGRATRIYGYIYAARPTRCVSSHARRLSSSGPPFRRLWDASPSRGRDHDAPSAHLVIAPGNKGLYSRQRSAGFLLRDFPRRSKISDRETRIGQRGSRSSLGAIIGQRGKNECRRGGGEKRG